VSITGSAACLDYRPSWGVTRSTIYVSNTLFDVIHITFDEYHWVRVKKNISDDSTSMCMTANNSPVKADIQSKENANGQDGSNGNKK
jgi:hypothetical protein